MAELGKKTLRAWRRLEKSHAAIHRRLEQALKSAKLPPLLWLRALEEAARHGEDGLRPFELQDALDLEQPAVSRLLEKMVVAALLTRTECPDDRRGWRVAATSLGLETRGRMKEVYEAALSAHFLGHLGEKQARALDEILGDLLDAHRSDEGFRPPARPAAT